MPVHYSPATLGNAGWAIESINNGTAARLLATSRGHKLTGAGLRVVIAAANTYYQSLTAAQVSTLTAVQGDALLRVDAGAVSIAVLPGDVTAQAAALAAVLTVAANGGAA
jgi:hypothetical protein